MSSAQKTSGAPSLRRFKPYPAYKDSGVEWLEDIPEHWEATKIKRHYSVQLGKMLQNERIGREDTLEPYLRAANIEWSGVLLDDLREMWMSSADKQTFALRHGDLLISEGGDVGRSALWNGELEHCYIQNAINRVRSGAGDTTKFLYYWVYALKHAGYIDMMCNRATIAHFTAEKVADTEVLLPPLAEQHAIAAFLDRETAKIDALVAKKERVIELLQEKRTALITRTVTKGLDPSVSMKNSGVEWLGEIPAHWEVSALKRKARRIQTGTTPPTGELQYYQDGTVAWYGPGSFADDLPLAEPSKLISEDAVRDGVARIFEEGSAAIVTIGATIGKVGFMEQPGSCNQQITVVSFDITRVFPKYGAYQLKRLEPVLRGIAPNTTLPIIDQAEVGYLQFILPPMEEQQAIVAFIDIHVAKIDALVAKIRRAIGRLKEYRAVLISAAVTGKIDVREEVG